MHVFVHKFNDKICFKLPTLIGVVLRSGSQIVPPCFSSSLHSTHNTGYCCFRWLFWMMQCRLLDAERTVATHTFYTNLKLHLQTPVSKTKGTHSNCELLVYSFATITYVNRHTSDSKKNLVPSLKYGGKTNSELRTLSGVPDNVVVPVNVGV